MKRNILFTVLLLFLFANHMFGIDSPFVYLDFGKKSVGFEVTDVINSKELVEFYGDYMAPDVMYSFTLNVDMDVTICNCGSSLENTQIYLLNSQMQKIDDNDGSYEEGACLEPHQAFLTRKLVAGRYYVITEGLLVNFPKEESIVTTIKGMPSGGDGDTMESAITLGEKTFDFSYSDTKDTKKYTNVDSERPTNEVFYKIILNVPMDITISHERSEVMDTYLRLFHEYRYEIVNNDDSWDTGASSVHTQSYMKIYSLSPGTYYIGSEGKSTNGRITTSITGCVSEYPGKGNTLDKAIDIGQKSADFTFRHTESSLEFFTDEYDCPSAEDRGYGNDIFYKFTLSKPMDITLTHIGSEIRDTFVHLLNASGDCIAHDCSGIMPGDVYSSLSWDDLPAGTYYVVSEGYWAEGCITTTITGKVDYSINTSENQNYILTTTPLKGASNMLDIATADRQQRVEYFDGLGRPTQTIDVYASKSGMCDLVSSLEYDGYGRESRLWLPTAFEGNKGALVSETAYKKRAAELYADSKSYSQTVYEDSPLNRIAEQYGPGESWHDNHKSVKDKYLTNVVGNDTLLCIHYTLETLSNDTVFILKKVGEYGSGELFVKRTEDEDCNVSLEFKDKLGRVVLSRQIEKEGNVPEVYDTYYIYDAWGNLAGVLPPKASGVFSRSNSTKWYSSNDVTIQQYAYLYVYDSFEHCRAKKLPGCGWQFYVYDKGGRLIFSQDGEQRKKGFWYFTIPDSFGRTCLSGFCLNSNLKALSISVLDSLVEARRDNSTGAYKGYTLKGVSLVDCHLLAVHYYDDYLFMGTNGLPIANDTFFSHHAVSGFKDTPGSCSKTYLTGVLTAQLSDTSAVEYLLDVLYYDARGRLIQKNSSGHLPNQLTSESITYNFSGEVLKRYFVHSVAGVDSLNELSKYAYDSHGRLLSVSHCLNDGPEVILSNKLYDSLGRLSSECRNGCDNLLTDYTYNVRSWIKSLNNPLFSQTLYYQDKRGRSSAPAYSGNISSMEWKWLTSEGDTKRHGYDFTYDDLSRLTSADYLEDGVRSSKFSTSYAYDKHGNLTSLKRCGAQGSGSYGLLDDLNLAYRGNQLMSVADKSLSQSSSLCMSFEDGSAQDVEYTYDANGSMTKDLNKKILNIQYNYLNLPSRIEFENGNVISYLYGADGTKLRTTHAIGNDTTITVYCGNVVYESGIPKTLLTEVGYVTLPDRKYHYFIQDHQGNNRLVVDQSGGIEEVNDYYPFGGTFADSSSVQPYKV